MSKVVQLPSRTLEPYVDLAEIREQFGFSERWWRYRLTDEAFPKYRYGGHWRFRRSEVERWIRERERDAS
jgi:predicted DNA-binding transcriptional regulator AlpA